MRNLFTLLLLATLFVSCSESKKYHLTGNAPFELEGETVYLQLPDVNQEYVVTDSAVITNGLFSFSGEVDVPVIAFLKHRQYYKGGRPLPLVLSKGKINITIDKFPVIEGSALNDSLNHFCNEEMKRLEAQFGLRNIRDDLRTSGKLDSATDQQITYQFDSIASEFNAFAERFIKQNNKNILGAYALSRQLAGMDPETLFGLMEDAGPDFSNSALGKKCINHAEAIKRSMPGSRFTDLTMDSPEGESISLSDYVGKGKYVLVDFWASWCSPCRKEMPDVVAAYAKYSDKNFEIVGVSFDNGPEPWKKGISSLQITWPQMSDLKGWKCAASEIYGIRSIPSTLLIDPNGIIIERNIKGEELDAVLAKYLN